MPNSTFFVSSAAVRNLKHRAERRITGVSSSHLSEALAYSLGFKTHAALRAALATQPTAEASKPSNSRLAQRLRELGYNAPDDLHLIPEFEHSYSPFRNFPLKEKRSTRWMAWRNLIVAAVNAALEKRLFGLSPEDNWWPGGHSESHMCNRYIYSFTIADDVSAIASVDAISGDELSINVILNPRNNDVEPDRAGGLSDGDAFAHAWIERSLGAWVQDGGEDFACKRAVQPWLAQLELKPAGYSDQGSFFM